ncbi:MAG: hypothetical protein KAQ63_01525, partial [Candidatus Moranbacteria bacterium]|nr:hypothetical protein [Candidatus Moranbacteria bacterium]
MNEEFPKSPEQKNFSEDTERALSDLGDAQKGEELADDLSQNDIDSLKASKEIPAEKIKTTGEILSRDEVDDLLDGLDSGEAAAQSQEKKPLVADQKVAEELIKQQNPGLDKKEARKTERIKDSLKRSDRIKESLEKRGFSVEDFEKAKKEKSGLLSFVKADVALSKVRDEKGENSPEYERALLEHRVRVNRVMQKDELKMSLESAEGTIAELKKNKKINLKKGESTKEIDENLEASQAVAGKYKKELEAGLVEEGGVTKTKETGNIEVVTPIGSGGRKIGEEIIATEKLALELDVAKNRYNKINDKDSKEAEK